MRIVQQTPTYLKLQENPLPARLWKLAVGLPFLISGIVSMIGMGEKAELMCDRPIPTEVRCLVTTRTLLRTTQTPIPTLQRAEVETRFGDQGNTYRVSLITRAQPIPLSQNWSPNRQEQQMKADVINVFLDDPSQPTLQMEQDGRWYIYPLGALFVGLGGFVVVTAWRTGGELDLCTFDKRSKQIHWRKRFTGRSPEKRDLKFQELEEVRVFRTKDLESDRPYTTRLILHSGEMLPLVSGHNQDQQMQLANTINRFLGITPTRKTPPSSQ